MIERQEKGAGKRVNEGKKHEKPMAILGQKRFKERIQMAMRHKRNVGRRVMDPKAGERNRRSERREGTDNSSEEKRTPRDK